MAWPTVVYVPGLARHSAAPHGQWHAQLLSNVALPAPYCLSMPVRLLPMQNRRYFRFSDSSSNNRAKDATLTDGAAYVTTSTTDEFGKLLFYMHLRMQPLAGLF